MFKFMKAAALLLVFFASTFAYAGGTSSKIAVLDPQAAVLATDLAQKKLKALENDPDFKSDKADFERELKEGQAMQKKLQKDSAIMSPDQKADAQKKLQDKASDIQFMRRKLAGRQQDAMENIMESMQAKFTKIVKHIIKSQHIGLLINKRAVISADNSYDITNEVTEALNKANGQ